METPDMMAETWLGALACADGSHTCSGNMPAFMPKPNRASQNSGASSAWSRIGPRSQPPVRPASMAKKAKKKGPGGGDRGPRRDQVPASRAPRKHGEEGEEKKPGHVRCR